MPSGQVELVAEGSGEQVEAFLAAVANRMADYIDGVAEKAEEPGERVADDRAAEVAHVHRFGHVRRAIVDDIRLGRIGPSNAQAFVASTTRSAAIVPPAVTSDGVDSRPRRWTGLFS